MLRDETHLRELSEAFTLAAVEGDWAAALEGLASACGGHAAELIGVGAPGRLNFHHVAGLSPELLAEFADAAGWDPKRNPRVKAGLAAAEMQVLSEADFADPEDPEGGRDYADQFARFDVPFSLQTNLLRERDGVVGLSVLRSARQGAASAADRKAFAALAPAAQGAVRLQRSLEGRAARLLTETFEALETAAFICDADGLVRRMTGAAEALAAASPRLTVTCGRLRVRGPGDGAALSLALAKAASTAAGVTEVALNADSGEPPLLLQLARLPSKDFPTGLAGRVLVLARPPRDAARRRAIVQAAFRLTAAEADIALAVGKGLSVEEIAHGRGVSPGTVRIQVKAIFAKLGVRRQAEVAARLALF